MQFLIDDPETNGDGQAVATILLAHGAGAPMDSPAMDALARALSVHGLRVARFEFGYMAARRFGQRKPPPRAETLVPEYLEAVEALGAEPLFIGGKSMGGRVASLVADDLFRAGRIRGLICFGYPFHPPAQPQKLRTGHLKRLETPALICQGTRDPFGGRGEVETYGLPGSVEILWLEDGDHDLKPRKKVSGFSVADHLRTVAGAAAAFAARLRR